MYISLKEFLELFTKEKPKDINEYILNAKVKMVKNIIPLKIYLNRKNIILEEDIIKNIEPLFNHIKNREKYLTLFYNRSLNVKDVIDDEKINNEKLNNNSILKNKIRSLFIKEILTDTKSGFDNKPSFMDVLFDLYQYPDSIIDYKLITPSAIYYTKNERIGSIFSSFYFRASIMSPVLVHNIRIKYFPNIKTLLTPTLGWCSYLMGFSLLKSERLKHYVGIDIIDSVCYHAKNTILGNFPPEKVDIYNCQSEKIIDNYNDFYTIYNNYFDVIFFSPPYYKMELYNGERQSTTQYKTYDDWLYNYWVKTIKMCKKVIKKGGIMSYIVSPFDKYDLPNDLLNITNKYFILKEIIPIYNKNINSTKHRSPNDNLYIYNVN